MQSSFKFGNPFQRQTEPPIFNQTPENSDKCLARPALSNFSIDNPGRHFSSTLCSLAGISAGGKLFSFSILWGFEDNLSSEVQSSYRLLDIFAVWCMYVCSLDVAFRSLRQFSLVVFTFANSAPQAASVARLPSSAPG